MFDTSEGADAERAAKAIIEFTDTNQTYFHLLLLAYNLINWFKRLCLPPEFQHATLQTVRQQILLMPDNSSAPETARDSISPPVASAKLPGSARCAP